MKFPTHAVLSASTGYLFGDIGGLYKVMSFLIGRDAYTHDLAFYGCKASAALKAAIPHLPVREDAEGTNRENYQLKLAEFEKTLGSEIDLPDRLRDSLADDKSANGWPRTSTRGEVMTHSESSRPVSEYQPRTVERLIEILNAHDQNPHSWQQETIAALRSKAGSEKVECE